jgi:hypothetical protein
MISWNFKIYSHKNRTLMLIYGHIFTVKHTKPYSLNIQNDSVL